MAKDKIEDILGLPVKVDSFLDGKERTAYPVTMRNFSTLIDNLARVNTKEFWTNFLFEDGFKALKEVFKITFRDSKIDDIIDNINAKNYHDIMSIILEINGIRFKDDEGKGKNKEEV